MKTNAHRILFIFAAFCIFSGGSCCNKDKSATIVEGIVQDAGNFNPVPNATVYIQRKKTDCFSCGYGTFVTLQADASGKFSYKFDAEKEYSYSVAAGANNYFSNISSGGVSINGGEKNSVSVRINPKAWLTIHVKNINPFDGNDYIGINPGGGYSFYGMNIDTFIIGKTVLGNQYTEVYWFVTKNNIQKSYSDKVYCPAFDTTGYTINY